MSRFARDRRVFFCEEPIVDGSRPELRVEVCPKTNVILIRPHLAEAENHERILPELFEEFAITNGIRRPIAWFYTPMAIRWLPDSLAPQVVVYDCMDELSLFRGAPPEMREREDALLAKADLVFTGGVSLYESKRRIHPNVYAFPSGVDFAHFSAARLIWRGFNEHVTIPRPRFGYAGVIDERIDLEMLDLVAQMRPAWQFVMIGPVVKLDPGKLPQRDNIHWLGMRDYKELPKYFGGWTVGILPFVLNEATRYLSPTKTPEYLAAGLPVISTAIRDVVRPYGELRLVHIIHSAEGFVEAGERVMELPPASLERREKVDEFLRNCSWDSVWRRINQLIEEFLQGRVAPRRRERVRALTAAADV